jgi:hypothetical protein
MLRVATGRNLLLRDCICLVICCDRSQLPLERMCITLGLGLSVYMSLKYAVDRLFHLTEICLLAADFPYLWPIASG